MTRVRTHLLLPPLQTADAEKYRNARAALENAARLYDQLRAKGYSHERAERLSMVGRLSGAAVTYTEGGAA